jgi:pimeloyl-ACP methyl ester carboxylesterase
MFSLIKSIGPRLLASLLSLTACAAGPQPEDVTGAPDLDVPAIIADAMAISEPGGIDDLVEVNIGGVPQWLSVRGRDRRNPILLFIHGGPGVTEMPVSWFYQVPLEDYFTVVQWDQRGSGKSAASADLDDVIPTVTTERMVQDGEEVVAYLRERYGKDKIFVLGHSWGSLIGLELARRHPDWLHAYVGMGQIIYTQGNEEAGYEFALSQARKMNNEAAIAELEAIAPYPKPDGSLPVPEILTQRKWLNYFGGMTWGRETLDYETNLRQLSPDYHALDHQADAEGSVGVVMSLIPQLGDTDYRSLTKLDVPVFLFLGRYDHAVSSQIAFDWFETLDAPSKQAIWFEHSAHMMQFEQPGRFVLSLVQEVRPVAEAAGDVAPEDKPGVGP